MSKKIRVADYIADFIYQYGVKDVFLLSGGGAMFLNDGIACHKKLRYWCLHHEQAAAMALETYSRITEHFGVGFFTTGCGVTNTITGLAGAWLDSVPCLFISGQVKKKHSTFFTQSPSRQIGVQELNIIPIVKSLTKYTGFVDHPQDIRFHLEKAIFLAKNGRPGPAWLDIPLDVQGALVNPAKLKGFNPIKKNNKKESKDWLTFKTQFTQAKRPVILAGQGVRLAKAIKDLLKLVEKYNIPVVTTFLGIDIIDSFHPCYVGRLGIKGTRAGNFAIQNSDFLIILGSSLPIAETGYEYAEFAREAKKAVVDVEIIPHKLRPLKIDYLFEEDAKKFIFKLSRILKQIKYKPSSKWLNICLNWRKKYPVCLPEYKKIKRRVNFYYFIDKLSAKLAPTDVVVTDAGSTFYAGSQAIKIKQGMRYITSGGFATMGFSLPASIGVSVALGKKRVICLTGDGSFQQNIQELQTVVHHQLPLKIFIFNNNGYLSIRTTQKKFFASRFIGEGPTSGVSFPDSRKIAKAYGIPFLKVSNNEKLKYILDRILEIKGPVICEIMTPKFQEIIPTTASVRQPDGTMVSRPLEDMYPFLDRKEFRENMIVKPLT